MSLGTPRQHQNICAILKSAMSTIDDLRRKRDRLTDDVRAEEWSPLESQKCPAVKKDGLICAAPARHGGFCLFHSPLGQDGRSKGGVSSSTVSRLERKLPPRHKELADKIIDMMGKVADGKASPTQLSALASAAKVVLSIYNLGETAMADIEERVSLSAEVESLAKAAQQKTENEAEGRSRYPAYCRCCEECDECSETCECECGCDDTPGGEDCSCQCAPCSHKAASSPG